MSDRDRLARALAQRVERVKEQDKDKQIEQLEKDLAKERDARKGNFFVYIFSLVVLLDLYFFTLMPTLTGPIVLAILELVLLLLVAKVMEIEEAAELLDKLLFRLASKGNHAD